MDTSPNLSSQRIAGAYLQLHHGSLAVNGSNVGPSCSKACGNPTRLVPIFPWILARPQPAEALRRSHESTTRTSTPEAAQGPGGASQHPVHSRRYLPFWYAHTLWGPIPDSSNQQLADNYLLAKARLYVGLLHAVSQHAHARAGVGKGRPFWPTSAANVCLRARHNVWRPTVWPPSRQYCQSRVPP